MSEPKQAIVEMKLALEGLVDNLEMVVESASIDNDGRSDEDGMNDGNDGNIKVSF